MRHYLLARRAGVPAAAVLLGLLAAGPAAADVTLSPATAEQGGGVDLRMHVVNDGTKPIGRITLTMPPDSPIGEVYPLSVDDWAPSIKWKTLSDPVPTMHGNVPTTQTTAAITWFAVAGKALAPGKATDLSISVGPLPTLSSMPLSITTTYTDGKPGPVMPPATLTLTPATGQTAQHGGHDAAGTGSAATDPATAAEEAAFAAAVAAAQRGPSFWSIAGWVVAALALLAAAVAMFRGRHRAEEDDEPDEDDSTDQPGEPAAGEAKEPVSAGGKWSFKG